MRSESLGRFAVIFVAVLVGGFILMSIVAPAEPPERCPPPPAFCADPPPGDDIEPGGTGESGGGGTRAPTEGNVAIPTPRPASDADRLRLGDTWVSTELGIGFPYDPARWTVQRSTDRDIAITSDDDGLVLVEAAPSTEWTPAQLVEDRLVFVRQAYPDLVVDTSPVHTIVGAHIGFQNAERAVSYQGTRVGINGLPNVPVGITIVSATDGRSSVLFMLAVEKPHELDSGDTIQNWARQSVDTLLKEFAWSGLP